MEKYFFELMAKFNKNANNLMNDIIKTLTSEQWMKQFSGFYKSIQEICSHIFFWDYNEFNRFKYLHNFTSLDDKFPYEEYLDIFTIRIDKNRQEYLDEKFTSSKKIFSDLSINDYIEMRTDLDNRITNFVDEMTTKDIEGIIKFKTIKGDKLENTIGNFLVNIFNHETHHRGMISVYLEMFGKENEFNDVASVWDKR